MSLFRLFVCFIIIIALSFSFDPYKIVNVCLAGRMWKHFLGGQGT